MSLTPLPNTSADPRMTPEQALRSHQLGTALYYLSAGLVLLALGLFGTASDGVVTILGITMAAKYVCLIYFILGGIAVWALTERPPPRRAPPVTVPHRLPSRPGTQLTAQRAADRPRTATDVRAALL